MKSMISASIMCADPLAMGRDLDLLEQNAVDYFHCDMMDGSFVPNLMLSTEIIRAVGERYATPMDIHLMVQQPEKVIPWLAIRPGDMISIHYESTPHVQRVLKMIRERGALAALALNPATPLMMAQEVLPDLDMLLVMTVNPGFAGQKLVVQCLDKIKRARKMLDDAGYGEIPIEVDGNCSFENVVTMERAGASIFVVGSSSVFHPEFGITKGMQKLRDSFIR